MDYSDREDKIPYHEHSLDTLGFLIRNLLIASDIQRVEHLTETKTNGESTKDAKTSHGFRKFATTNMIRAKVNPEPRELLLGHSIGPSDSYYRPDTNEILEYPKTVNLLTINEENRLRRNVEILEVKADKIEELLKTIDYVKSKLGLT
jgi:hypothetical protein